MQPLVSIIIPTHRASHFKTALMCALGQTYANTEIIVSDNSSTSEIADICSRYPQVIYRKNTDGKPASNISLPLALATGDYIKYLFDDDLIYPNCIDSMIGWLEKFSPENIAKIGIITSARHLVNDESICYSEINEAGINTTSIIDGLPLAKRILITQDNFIGEFSTIMFRRNLVDCKNPLSIFSIFGEDFSYGLVDVPLYIDLLQKSSLLYIPYSLSAFRKHAGGGSNVAANPGFHYVVSDWFRLTRGAYAAGLLNENEAKASATNYLNLSAQFDDVFFEQLTPWRNEASEFAAKHVTN
jgi:glycosyltransferase involved in cell wall biosynthesis